MLQDEVLDHNGLGREQVGNYKLYSKRGTLWGTFFGGPIAGGWFFYSNFKNLGYEKEAKAALTISLLVLIAVSLLSVFAADVMNVIPDLVFTGVYLLIVWFAFVKYLKYEVEQHFHKGGGRYREGNIFLVVVLSGILTLIIMFGIILTLEYWLYGIEPSEYFSY